MKLMILIPKVIQSYRNRFPETRNNAYRYFNYDRRVVQESVPRGDIISQYKTPDDLTDADYGALVTYAKGIVNPILMKYSARVACEDALSSAIRSFANGMFDSKVNAGRYAVLLDSMMGKNEVICPCLNTPPYKFSKKAPPKKAPKKEEDVGLELKMPLLRQLKLQDKKKKKGIPVKERVRLRKGPQIFTEKGKIILKTADGSEPNQYLMDFLNMIPELPTKDMDVVRKLVGRWSQAKGLIKEFLSNCIKECGMDKGYVQQVSEEVKKAVSLLDRLEDVYQKVNEFDMDEIKTRMEPLLELIDRVKQGDTGEETPPEDGAPEAPPEESVTETEEMDISPEKEKAMLKNAKEYTERLDKIAEEIEQISPEAALQIDLISDVIEGRREASTLKFDPDEARYMKNRFNFDVRKREADEPYMDEFNKSDFEQVEDVKKNPEPIKKNASLPYQKIEG